MDELRYPFTSLTEFLGGAYLFDPLAAHLTFGLVCMVFTIVAAIRLAPTFRHGLLMLFFVLAPYNNPAYTVLGIAPNEVLGLIGIILSAFHRPVDLRPASAFLSGAYLVVFFMFGYTLLVLMITPELLTADTSLAGRIIVFGKPILLVLLGNLLVREHEAVSPNIDKVALWAIFGICITYLLQVGALLALGALPYGSFLSAGNIGLISFGGTSIERGHLGKFLAPLLPIVVLALFRGRSRVVGLLFFLICTINFSASSYVFFLFLSLLSLILLWSRVRAVTWILVLVIGGGAATALIINFGWAIYSLVEKIIELAIHGDETEGGGRSVGILLEYLARFPLGIGYGGSTYRTAPGLPEINAGLFAFITQLSVLGILILLLWLAWLLRFTVTQAISRRRHDTESLVLAAGVFAMPLIFFADILWFVPTVWLAFFLLHGRIRSRRLNRRSTPVPYRRNAVAPIAG